MDQSPLKNIVFSSSGVGGFAYLGVLKALEEYNIRATNYTGSSGGALIGAFACLDISVDDMINYTLATDFRKFLDSGDIPWSKEINFMTKDGWYKGDALFNWIRGGFSKFINKPDITFKQLYDVTGRNSTMMVSNLTKATIESYNSYDTPDSVVAFGGRVTSSVPIFFEPITVNNNIYVDSGYFAPFPFFIHEKEIDKTWGWRVVRGPKYNNNNKTGVDEYMKKLLLTPALIIEEWQTVPGSEDRTTTIQIDEVDLLDFRLNNNQKRSMINQTYETTKDQLRRGKIIK